jgi:uncharacterized protein (TIGR02452 family)
MANYDKIAVWQDTYNRFLYEPDPNPPSKKYVFGMISSTLVRRFPVTQVKVHKYDIIDMALIEKYANKEKVIFLNMADIAKPGGCVEAGSGAQEECIFRRSNYYKHLTKEFYPMLNNDIILSKNVKFTKHNEDKGNSPMAPHHLDIMAIPAVRFPQLDNSFTKYGDNKDLWLMKSKIDSMFRLGYIENYDVLVLSAFGCGAYGNPQREVAKIFKENVKKYKGCFKKVIFAVLGSNYNFFTELEGTY